MSCAPPPPPFPPFPASLAMWVPLSFWPHVDSHVPRTIPNRLGSSWRILSASSLWLCLLDFSLSPVEDARFGTQAEISNFTCLYPNLEGQGLLLWVFIFTDKPTTRQPVIGFHIPLHLDEKPAKARESQLNKICYQCFSSFPFDYWPRLRSAIYPGETLCLGKIIIIIVRQ